MKKKPQTQQAMGYREMVAMLEGMFFLSSLCCASLPSPSSSKMQRHLQVKSIATEQPP